MNPKTRIYKFTQHYKARSGALTTDERVRLRRAWTEEPDLTLSILSDRFRISIAEVKKECADLQRPRRTSVWQVRKGVIAALNNV